MISNGMPLTTGKPRFDQVEIGNRVRVRRLEIGISAATLGKRVGIAEDSMLKKEKGIAPFYFGELARLGDELNAPALWPILDWDTAYLLEQLLPPTLRAKTDDESG